MLSEKQWSTNVGVGLGALMQLAGLILYRIGNGLGMLGLVLLLASLPVFAWGSMSYVESKGHPRWVGLLGLAGVLGLVILIVLPDRDGPGGAGLWLRLALVLSMLVGLVLVGYGVDVDQRHLGGPSPGPTPFVCMIAGGILVAGSLLLLLRSVNRSSELSKS